MRKRAGEQGTDGARGEWPDQPAPQIERPELLGEIMDALSAHHRTVAVTGPAGAGKTVMAARACVDRRLLRYFRNGIVWLEAGDTPDPVELLAALAHRLRMTGAATTSASVERARELLQPALAGKRLLIVVDNVSQRAVIDAFRDLAPSCTVMVTSRVPELAAVVKAAQIQVDRLTPDQSLELLGLWAGHDRAKLPPEAEMLCAKSGRLALAVAVVGGKVGTRSIPKALELVERFLDRAQFGSGAPSGSEALPHLIAAGIAAMPKARRSRYEKLAVFAG